MPSTVRVKAMPSSSTYCVRLNGNLRALGLHPRGTLVRAGQVLTVERFEPPGPRDALEPGEVEIRIVRGSLASAWLRGVEGRNGDWDVVPADTMEVVRPVVPDYQSMQVLGIGRAGVAAVERLRDSDCGGLIEEVPMHILDPWHDGAPALEGGLMDGAEDADLARVAARRALPALLETIGEPPVVVLLAALRDPFGAGAAPVVAKALRERGIDVVAVVDRSDLPAARSALATEDLALRCLAEHAGSVVLVGATGRSMGTSSGPDLGDELAQPARVLLAPREQGLIGLDLDDVRQYVLAQQGRIARFGSGLSGGPSRAPEAMRQAMGSLHSPALDRARAFFVRIAAGRYLLLSEISAAIEALQLVARDRTIMFQGVVDDWLDGELTVGLVAAGCESAREERRVRGNRPGA